MAECDSDDSWQTYSVDSDRFSCESGTSSSSDNDINVEASEEEIIVRGAEPYRFEPLAARPDESRGESAEDDEADHAEAAEPVGENRLENTDWCSCGKCIVMDTVENCKCCREMDVFKEKINHTDMDPETLQCFTDHPWYEATCLNPGTLETAYFHFKQQYGARAVEGDRASKYRHVSYRQVVRWCWGFLGRHNRVRLPSCIINKTRTTYPDPEGSYKGFRYPDLDE